MPETELIQPLPEKYTKDTIDLSGPVRNERDRFLRELDAHAKKEWKVGRPFCFKCAKADYELAQESAAKRKGVKEAETLNVKIPFDLKSYGEKARFFEKNSREINRKRVIDGVARYMTFKYSEWYCRQRGCGFSLEVPDEKKK